MMTRKRFSLADFADAAWMAYAAIFITVLLTFGVFISRLGLYGSQWQRVLFPGGEEVGQYGISGWITSGLISLIGKNVLIYHLLNAVLLFMLGIIVYRFLSGAGLGRVYSLAVTLVYLVFPGFSQASSAFDFTVIMLGLIAALLSLRFYTHAIQSISLRKKIDFWCGVILALLSILVSPVSAFFTGSSVFIFFLCVSPGAFSRKSLSNLMGTAHLICALVIPSILLNGKVRISIRVIIQSVKSLTGAFLLSWRKIIAFPADGMKVFLYFIVLALAIAGFAFVLKQIKSKESNQSDKVKKDIFIAGFSLAVGLFVILISGVLSVSTGTEYPDDMNMAVTGLLASVFIVAMVRILIEEKFQILLLAILIGLSMGARYQSSERFAIENQRVQNFLSQLQVRADSIQPGTSLLVEQLPFEFTSRESVEALVRDRMGKAEGNVEDIHIVPAENPDVREFLANSDKESVYIRIGTKAIDINKHNLTAIWMPANGCLQILEPGGVYGEIPQGLTLASQYSDSEKFVVKNMSDVIQLDKFRTTIELDNCFKTQMIQRYAANSQWDDVIGTFVEEQKTSGTEFDFSIVKPVLEAMMEKGRLDDAEAIAREFSNSPEQKKSICQVMTETITRNSSNQEVVRTASQAMKESGCH